MPIMHTAVVKSTDKHDTPAQKAVSADRVKEMLHEIAFVLHATRVVGQKVRQARRVKDQVEPAKRPSLMAG